MTDMIHLDYLEAVAAEDLAEVRRKEASYRGSWKRRGGVGAFMMLARKWDRLETMLGGRTGGRAPYDIFNDMGDGSDGSPLAEVRDLRRYLLLVEAELVARGAVERMVPRFESSNEIGIAEAAKVILYDAFSPGTPEDGGHHAPRDGTRPEDGFLYLPTGWFFILVHHPTGQKYYNVDRSKYNPEEVEHLPALALELNHKEYQGTPTEYQAMYEWVEGEVKWRLAAPYREHWGRPS